MEKTILFGNGINRISSDTCSWSNILNGRVDENLIKIPNTLQYESAYLSACRDNFKCQNNSNRDKETLFKEDILKGIMSDSPNKIYEKLAGLPIKYFITTI